MTTTTFEALKAKKPQDIEAVIGLELWTMNYVLLLFNNNT